MSEVFKADDVDKETIGWVVGAAGAIGTALSTAAATVYRTIEGKNRQIIDNMRDSVTAIETRSAALEKKLEESDKKHDDCQRDREELRVELAEVKARVCQVDKNA